MVNIVKIGPEFPDFPFFFKGEMERERERLLEKKKDKENEIEKQKRASNKILFAFLSKKRNKKKR